MAVMPRKKTFDVNDPVVMAVLGTPTSHRVWTDARLLKTLLARGSVPAGLAGNLTLEELNKKLGPKGRPNYENVALGLYRRHYTIDGVFRCAYLILSAAERARGFFDVGLVEFPTAENAIWDLSRAQEPVELRPEETKEETKEEAKEEAKEETEDTEMADAPREGAAGGRKRKETTKTGMTPSEKRERPVQPTTADLVALME